MRRPFCGRWPAASVPIADAAAYPLPLFRPNGRDDLLGQTTARVKPVKKMPEVANCRRLNLMPGRSLRSRTWPFSQPKPD